MNNPYPHSNYSRRLADPLSGETRRKGGRRKKPNRLAALLLLPIGIGFIWFSLRERPKARVGVLPLASKTTIESINGRTALLQTGYALVSANLPDWWGRDSLHVHIKDIRVLTRDNHEFTSYPLKSWPKNPQAGAAVLHHEKFNIGEGQYEAGVAWLVPATAQLAGATVLTDIQVVDGYNPQTDSFKKVVYTTQIKRFLAPDCQIPTGTTPTTC